MDSADRFMIKLILGVVLIATVGVGSCGAYDSSLRHKRDMACIERSGVTCDQAMKRCPEGKP
jgi:hypothetical protein